MRHSVRTMAVSGGAALAVLLATAAHAAEDIFAVNVAREKQLIDGHLKEAGELLDANKLQQSRATLRLVEDRLAAVKKSLSKPERQDIEARRDAVVARMRTKEDSLVAVAKGKVATEGLDAAIDYSQQVLRRIGLPEERFQEIDKYLLEEAPKLQQKKESDAIDRAVKAIEQGRQVPGDVDPYLAMTARQMVQARRDSARAAKEQERERARSAEEARRGKEAARVAAEERRKQEALERQAQAALEKERAETERRQREEQARADRAREQRERETLERQRREQEAAAREERERQALAEKRQAEEQLAAIAREREAQKAQKRKEDEAARQQREAEALARKQEAEKQLAVAKREREAAAAAQREHEARLAAQQAEDAELRQRQTAEERALSEQRASAAPTADTAGEHEVVPYIEVAVRTETAGVNELARQREEEERAREAQAREREKRIEEARREEQRIAALEKFNRGQTTFQETEQAAGTTASVREYMRQRKEEETRAQSVAVQIYELLERKKPAEALALFRGKRDYLAQYLSKEVFVVLERSVVSAAPATVTPAAQASAGSPPPSELPKEEQYVMRIRAYLSERKWEPAVSLFDATEKSLKKYMQKEEFDRLKGMVASARQYARQK